MRHIADKLDTREVLHFTGEKMLSQYFWWDSMVLCRKIALVVCGSLAVTANSVGGVALTWYFGTGIIIISLALHAFARPFYDQLADTTEFLGLITMLILFQSGIVFKYDCLFFPSAFSPYNLMWVYVCSVVLGRHSSKLVTCRTGCLMIRKTHGTIRQTSTQI